MIEVVCTLVLMFGPLDMNSTKPITWADLNMGMSRKEHCKAVKGRKTHKMPKRRR